MKPIRVALVYLDDASFVQRDRAILGSAFAVRDVPCKGKRAIPRIIWSVLRSDVAFCWFALDHAYVACRAARLAGKKCVVIVGGLDAAKRPDLGYGAHLDPGMSRRTAYTIAHADRVLLVEDHLRDELVRNTGVARPDLTTVPLGFDTDWFSPGPGPRSGVLTVAIVNDVNVSRKGLDVFVETARRLPDLAFVLVGGRDNAATERLRAGATPNVRILGRIRDEELREEFRRARVYVQLSRYEAFGSALGEAMACGCVPVGTDVGGIAALIDGTGRLVPVGDVDATVQAIREADAAGDGLAARRRIVAQYSIDRRRRALAEVIESLVPR
ncbi:MAG TPA: glycosyltransferase family 4 protein [Thermoplasmata archaeon]|nr:glycosyltransferase family 4 protein [Thermoplasmata archaeon]